MIDKDSFYSQFEAFENYQLQITTCGVSSLAMVLQSENRFKEFKNRKHSLEPFLEYLLNHHVNGSKSVVSRHIDSRGYEYNITVGLESEVIPEDGDSISIGLENNFFPVFTLGKGYDHRCSEFIFGEFGLKAEYRSRYTLKNLQVDFMKGKIKYFLPSIHSLRSRGSHIVVMQDISSDNKGEYIEIVDPSEKTYDFAVKRFEPAFFKKLYNNKGTVIFNSNDNFEKRL